MCGIVLAFTPRQPTTAATVAAMAAALRHRGPDDEGYLLWDLQGAPRLLGGADTPAAVMDTPTAWQPQARVADEPQRAAPLALGHRRLAIVDLSPGGHQPMARDGRWHVVYNGEIYNHLELRAELEALGQHFHTHSDTEVLLAAIAAWGPQRALARCNGMWAFALLDTARRTLLIARDRFGVKPLYLWRGEGGALLLASEVKALLAHPAVRAAADEGRCVDFLQRGPSAWRPDTEFQGITRFPAGHWAELALDSPGALQLQAFWQRPAPADADEPFDAGRARAHAARYAELLDDAVRLRLRADVRLGTALSGGLDSSSIAALVNARLRAQGSDGQQETFSSVYRGEGVRGADESAFVARVVARLGVHSNLIDLLAGLVAGVDLTKASIEGAVSALNGLYAKDGSGALERLSTSIGSSSGSQIDSSTAANMAQAGIIAAVIQGVDLTKVKVKKADGSDSGTNYASYEALVWDRSEKCKGGACKIRKG